MARNENRFTLHGNAKTFNINSAILYKIQSSAYFKGLYELKTYHEVIDEIYNTVEYLDPWAKLHQVQEPSQAFCLLYKLCLMRMTVKQILGLLNHPDSPYINGIGFLYLRYVCPPDRLWEFFEPHLDRDEEVYVRADSRRPMKLGELVSSLLLNMKFGDTLLPRIPVPIQRDLEKKLRHDSERRRGSRMTSEGGDKDRGRDRDRDRERDRDHSRDRDRERDRDRDRSRDRDRDGSRGHQRHRHHERHSSRHHRHRDHRDRSSSPGVRRRSSLSPLKDKRRRYD